MHKRIILLFLLTSSFVITSSAQQQTRTLTGLVTTADGSPLEGVSVQIKGKKYFSGSQADGIYYIPVQAGDSILVFCHPEYQPQEIRVSFEREYNVKLKIKQLRNSR